jgi:hypothetical protein
MKKLLCVLGVALWMTVVYAQVEEWGFDDGQGAVVAGVNGHDGVVVGTPTWVGGKYGEALLFNGATRVDVVDDDIFDFTTSMTMMAWVLPTGAAGGWRDVVMKSVDMYYLDINGPTLATGGTYAGGSLFGPTLQANVWTHVASSFDGTTIRLFVNGVQVASKVAASSTIATSSGALSFGGDGTFGQYWVGVIDEVRVFSEALTAAQIAVYMNTPVAEPPQPPFDGLVMTIDPEGTNAALGSPWMFCWPEEGHTYQYLYVKYDLGVGVMWECSEGVSEERACDGGYCCFPFFVEPTAPIGYFDLVGRDEVFNGSTWECFDEPEENGPRNACACHTSGGQALSEGYAFKRRAKVVSGRSVAR